MRKGEITMIGCQYCRMEENGDIGYDLAPLMVIRKKYEAITPDVKINAEANLIGIMNTHVEVSDGRLHVIIGEACHIERKINYCPVCGRSL